MATTLRKIENTIKKTNRGVEVSVKWTDSYGIEVRENGKINYYMITEHGTKKNMKRSKFSKISPKYFELMALSQQLKG